MGYALVYSKQADKALESIDNSSRALILTWLHKNIKNSLNPKAFGKPLSGTLKGAYRYRIGAYRVIVDINDDTVTVLVLDAGNRKDIYKKYQK